MAKVQTAEKHAFLRQLNVFVDEWEVEAFVDGKPAGRSKVMFSWK